MADWTPVEKVAKNAEGKFVALHNGAWVPVDKAAKNAEGKFMVLGLPAAAPAATPPAAAAPQEEPSGAYLWNKFKQGVAALPAMGPLAADVVAMPLRPYERLLGRNVPQSMFPATEQYNRAIESTGAYDPHMPVPRDESGQPRFTAEVAGNIAEMAGMNVIPGAGTVMRSARPGVALAKELAGTALAGEGMTMGGYLANLDVFGEPSERKKAAGEALGSMTGPLLVQKAIDAAVKGGNWISKMGIPTGLTQASRDAQMQRFAEQQMEQAKEVAAGRLRPQLETEAAQQAIARSKDVASRVPGFGENLTLGRVTGSPAVKSMEHHFASTDPAMLEAAGQRERGLQEAIRQYSEKRFPASEWSAQDELKYVYADKLRSFDEGLKNLDRQERKLAASLPRGDIEEIGTQQRKLVTDRLNLARQKKDALYKEVAATADKLGVKVNVGDVVDVAKASAGSNFRKFQEDPGIVGKILREYSAEGKVQPPTVKTTPAGGKITLRGAAQAQKPPVATYGEFESLYREANREADVLARAASAGDMQAAQKLPVVNSVRGVLKAKIEEMASPAHGELGKKLMTANSYYRDQYAPLFKRGAGAEILKDGRFGPATENAKITESLIFKKGDPSGVSEFLTVAGNDPRGRQLLENGIFDMLSKRVVRDGKVSKTALEAFLREYKEPLSAVPDIRKKIESVERATASLKENTARAVNGRSDLARSTLASVAAEENPAKIIANAIKSPKYMDTLLLNAGAESRKDLARGIMEHVLGTPNSAQFMKTNEKTLRKVLGGRQFANLRTISQAREIAESVKPPGYVQYQKEGDVLAGYGTTVKQAVSSAIAVARGRSGKVQEMSGMGARWWDKLRNDEVERLMKSAVYDPELARAIADYSRSGTKAAEKVLNDHLVAHGIRSVAATVLGQGQRDDDTMPPKGAVQP